MKEETFKFSYHEHNTIPKSSVLCMLPSHKQKKSSFYTIENLCLARVESNEREGQRHLPPSSIRTI